MKHIHHIHIQMLKVVVSLVSPKGGGGIFVSFFPETRISLERQELTPEGAPVFELASCRRCGQAYLVGNIMDGKLKHTLAEVEEPKQNRYFLLTDKRHLFEEDED